MRTVSAPGAAVTETVIDLTPEERRRLMTSGRIPPVKLSPDDRVHVETVTHKTRTAILFGLVVWGSVAVAFWVTATPRRWVPVLIGAACGGVLFALLR